MGDRTGGHHIAKGAEGPRIDLRGIADALRKMETPPDRPKGCFRTEELARAVGHTEDWVRRNLLKPALSRGEVECVSVKVQDMRGAWTTRTMYSLKGKARA